MEWNDLSQAAQTLYMIDGDIVLLAIVLRFWPLVGQCVGVLRRLLWMLCVEDDLSEWLALCLHCVVLMSLGSWR